MLIGLGEADGTGGVGSHTGLGRGHGSRRGIYTSLGYNIDQYGSQLRHGVSFLVLSQV